MQTAKCNLPVCKIEKLGRAEELLRILFTELSKVKPTNYIEVPTAMPK